MRATFHASSASSAGVFPAADPGTYTYRVSTPPCDLTSTAGATMPLLRLASDGGQVEYLVGPLGSVYPNAGNWTGTYVARTTPERPSVTDQICPVQAWSLFLTVAR
jgi:hypothetical protein